MPAAPTSSFGADIWPDAKAFCDDHMRTVNTNECVNRLTLQVQILRKQRAYEERDLETLNEIDSFTFAIRDTRGEPIRFIHREGYNLLTEFTFFCLDYLPTEPKAECEYFMLQMADKALDRMREGGYSTHQHHGHVNNHGHDVHFDLEHD